MDFRNRQKDAGSPVFWGPLPALRADVAGEFIQAKKAAGAYLVSASSYQF